MKKILPIDNKINSLLGMRAKLKSNKSFMKIIDEKR